MSKADPFAQADLEVETDERGVEFLRDHPMVERLEAAPSPGEPGNIFVSIHLMKPASWGEAGEPWPPAPEGRPHDLEFFGTGRPNLDFWDRTPRTAHQRRFFEALGDEVYPDGWWTIRLWLS